MLIASFFHRNSIPGFDLVESIDRLDTFKLADLLANKEVEPERPNLATRLTDPKKIEATVSVAATVGEFMEMLEQIKAARGHGNHDWPLVVFTSAVGEVIDDAKKHFYKYSEATDGSKS